MKRGPRPTPTRLKLLKGTFRPDRASNCPEPSPEVPEVPEWLSLEAKAEWSRLAPQLADLGLLSALDRASFAAYCSAWSDFRESSEHVATEGAILVSAAGGKYENPWLSIKKRSSEALRKWGAEFGISPAARTSLHVAPKAKPVINKYERLTS
jgi:P27 family predicted phage terminase small subunit